jgi:hypothetical protein
LTIQRVVCLGCWVTHALIPEHSLPQTSQDTQAVTTYLWNRAADVSRHLAGADILAMGFAQKTLKNLERSFVRCSHNLAALLNFELPPVLNLVTLAARLGLEAGPRFLLDANRLALGRRVNAAFNSRSSILIFHDRRPRNPIPHNLGPARLSRVPPDSS